MGVKEMVTVINLSRGKVTWSEEAAVQNSLLMHCRSLRDCYLRDDLLKYQPRIEALAKVENSSFYYFKKFFQGPSHKESVALNEIKNTIEGYLMHLGGFLSKQANGWKSFSSKDKIRNEIVFSADKFTQIMSNQLEFRKEFSRSQLLSCFSRKRKKLMKVITKV